MAEAAMVRRDTGESLSFLTSDTGWKKFTDVAAILSSGGADPTARMIPQAFKSPQQVQAGLLLGLSLGYDLLGSIALLQSMVPVKGKLGFTWDWKLARVYQLCPEWDYGIKVTDDKKCTAWFQRTPRHQKFELTYTIEQAQKAGLVKTGDRGDSAWITNATEMIRKTCIVRGIALTAPDALLGVPREVWEQDEPEPETPATPAVDGKAVSTAVVVEMGGEHNPAASIGGGPKGETPPITPTQPDASAESAKEAFLSEVEKKGWNRKHGPSLYKLMQELLTVEGVAPAWKRIDEVASGDWRRAYVALCEKYSNGKPEGWPAKSGKAAGTSPSSAGAAPANGDAPPPPGPSAPEPESEKDAEAAQRQHPDFLVQLGQELERALKVNSGTIVTNTSAKAGKFTWWFVHEGTLVECGFTQVKEGKTVAKTMTLSPSQQYPDRVLTPEQIGQLSEAVQRRLRDLAQRRAR